ncbi:unnamed protein product [Arctia plantaginis]|uniref:Enhancer of polycomb-like protein n=1 Tax=Arctia plantaginis TaxID=874455 RepID=A0A8S1BU49_ARCPL|nr:unnamed protein product [Arctia plantaginis]
MIFNEDIEHHLQRAISGTGLIIPTPEVCQVSDLEFYERCYPPDYKMPKQHIHMQPLWEEQEAPEYDIDSEDERWLKQQRHPELTELKFEQMMDKLEKSSGQTVVTLNEAKLLLERNDDLVIAVYDYWLNKRLNTQHPLVLSVKTENRPGQSSNNPYLAFRRRTEKMQTRKNRKNDESSYEKMLKLRRDIARALSLLEMVARRESAKRDLVKLTALIAERRYAAGDFANQLLPDPPPRPAYTAVQIASSNFRREAYTLPHYPPRPPPTPVDQPRQREKRPYKRRKHRHPAPGIVQGLRDSGVYTSSEEEPSRAETATPPDDGPFAFRRKPGCYYEMPTSTLHGDPVDPEDPSKQGMYEHEMDERHRYTLTSLRAPGSGGAGRCVGFARRRATRGGRLALDRVRTPLDDLLPDLPFSFPHSHHYRQEKDEEVELETQAHRTPKEMSRDYHTSGKYPWRHAFRRHLARNPDLWTEPAPDDVDVKLSDVDVKPEPMDEEEPHGTPTLADRADNLPDVIQDSVKSDIRFSARTIDNVVRENIDRVMRKRAYSACSDSSYDSDESLQPVEMEFEKFFNEVKKWLHFRPKTPPQSPMREDKHEDQFPVALDTPISVELRAAEKPPSEELGTFTTSEFTLGELYPEINPDVDNSGSSLDISGDDLLTDNFTGLTEAQVESILSETDLKELADEADKKIAITDDILDELVNNVDAKDSFLLHGQSSEGRADSGPRKRKADSFGSTVVNVTPVDKEPIYVDMVIPEPPPVKLETPKKIKDEKINDIPAPVPNSKIIVEEVNEVPQIKIEKKRKEDTIEEVQLPHGVQLKTVQTKHSPLKKHIITSAGHRRASDVTIVTSVAASDPPTLPQVQAASQPQIVTVAVSDSLKVRLQNHLLSSQAGVLVQNGPFPPVAVAVPVQQRDGTGTASVSGVSAVTASVSSSVAASAAGAARRVSAPLVQLAGTALGHKHVHVHGAAHSSPLVVAQSHTIHHVAPSKLKVLHAHPLTQSQRTALLAQNRALQGLPAVVSLASLDGKAPAAALLKAAPGGVAQLFEIKGGQLGKGPHLVNVVRGPPPRPAPDDKRRVNLSLDGRQLVMPVRQQIQLRTRPLPLTRPETPRALVANLLHKGVPLPRNVTGVQAIAFAPGGALKTARARLVGPARAAPAPATDAPPAAAPGAAPPDPDTPRADTLPMEVT